MNFPSQTLSTPHTRTHITILTLLQDLLLTMMPIIRYIGRMSGVGSC